jgi:hypothetical protein
MSKRKKPPNKNKEQKALQEKGKKLDSKCLDWKQGFWKKLLSLLTYIGLILSIVSAIYFFLPKIKIYTGDSLDPSNPFKTPFIIENQTVLPIYDIEFICGIRDVKAEKQNVTFQNLGTSFASDPIPILLGNESTTTFCAFPFKTREPITSADIEIIVKYKPTFFWKQTSLSMRFNALQNIDGNLFWFPKSLSEK